MKPIQKIQLDIYKDKLADFYLTLFTCKIRDNPDESTLRKLVDAIHFDKDSFLKFFEPTEIQQQKINSKLLSVHNYILKSKKDSEDYFKVSKENFIKFQTSEFGKSLFELMNMIELSKQWSGQEKTAEVKTAVALMSAFTSLLMQGLEKSMTNSMNNVLNVAAAIQESIHEKYKIFSNEKGNILIQAGEEEVLEMELFIEKGGKFVKTDALSENDIDFGKNNSFFLKTENHYLQFKPDTHNSYEIMHYENVNVKNGKLDLSKATIKHKLSVPKEQKEVEIIEEADGNILYQLKQITQENTTPESTVQLETTETITLNDNPASAKRNRKTTQDENAKVKTISSSVFASFDDFITEFLKLPQNVPEYIEARDKIILGVYELLKQFYPDISNHSSCTITGFICAEMGWMETEDQHIGSKRKQTYRKYLTDTIGNTLRKHQIR